MEFMTTTITTMSVFSTGASTAMTTSTSTSTSTITITIRRVCTVSFVLLIILICNSTFKIQIVLRENHTFSSSQSLLATITKTNVQETLVQTDTTTKIIKTNAVNLNPNLQEDINQQSYQCQQSRYTTGEWRRRDNNNNNNDQITSSYDTDGTLYEWIVTDPNCTLQLWDPTTFCQLLNGRSILFVGDSLSGGIFKALLHQYSSSSSSSSTTTTTTSNNNGTVEQYQFIEKKTIPVQITDTICQNTNNNLQPNNNVRITYVRNDWISTSNVIKDVVERSRLLTPWIHLIKYNTILILNTGAHRRTSASFRANIRHIRDIILQYNTNINNDNSKRQEQQQQLQKQVIFWTTPRGHVNCTEKDIVPIKDIHDPNYKRFFNPDDTTYFEYNYNTFGEYNRIIKKIIDKPIHYTTGTTPGTNEQQQQEEQQYKWGHIIDIAPIFELRPDVHNPAMNDCLHINSNKELVLTIFFQLLQNLLNGNL